MQPWSRSTRSHSGSSRSWHESRPELELIRETSLEALAPNRAPRRDRHRRGPQPPHGQRGASPGRRARGGRRAAAALPPRRRLAARAPRRLLRPGARPGGGASADRAGRSALSRRARDRSEGLPYRWPAAREGGPRNGVLTALEDFVAERHDLRVAIIPAFFGLAIVWPRGRGLGGGRGRRRRTRRSQPAAGAARAESRPAPGRGTVTTRTSSRRSSCGPSARTSCSDASRARVPSRSPDCSRGCGAAAAHPHRRRAPRQARLAGYRRGSGGGAARWPCEAAR